MRLIDADALLERLTVDPVECPGCPEPEFLHEFVALIENAPTVDAIPVVRCKNCKYSDGGTDEDGKLFLKCLGWVYGGTREDDFCSHGERNERKDGDEHG